MCEASVLLDSNSSGAPEMTSFWSTARCAITCLSPLRIYIYVITNFLEFLSVHVLLFHMYFIDNWIMWVFWIQYFNIIWSIILNFEQNFLTISNITCWFFIRLIKDSYVGNISVLLMLRIHHWPSLEISVTSNPYMLGLNPHCAWNLRSSGVLRCVVW
jgi:hypothetical protein